MSLATTAGFDYQALDVPTRAFVEERTGLIRERVNRSMCDMIEIGVWLAEVKASLGHGRFGPWLEAEFEWSQDTAERLMQVGKAMSKFRTVRNLDIAPTGLYALAEKSTPAPAREEAVALSNAGEHVTTAQAREIIAKHKQSADAADAADAAEDEEDEGEEEEAEEEAEEEYRERPEPPRPPHPDEKFFDNLMDLLLASFIAIEKRGGIARVARHSGPQAAVAAVTRLEKLAAYCEGFIDILKHKETH